MPYNHRWRFQPLVKSAYDETIPLPKEVCYWVRGPFWWGEKNLISVGRNPSKGSSPSVLCKVLFTQTVSTAVVDIDKTVPELRHVDRYFGTLPYTMLSLFMSITGGVSWEAVITPLGYISPVWACLFLFYISFLGGNWLLQVLYSFPRPVKSILAVMGKNVVARPPMSGSHTLLQLGMPEYSI